jgi:hypothetical protein
MTPRQRYLILESGEVGRIPPGRRARFSGETPCPTAGNAMNLVNARQDRRIVETRQPEGPGEGRGDRPFRGDGAIMEYRRMRAAVLGK